MASYRNRETPCLRRPFRQGAGRIKLTLLTGHTTPQPQNRFPHSEQRRDEQFLFTCSQTAFVILSEVCGAKNLSCLVILTWRANAEIDGTAGTARPVPLVLPSNPAANPTPTPSAMARRSDEFHPTPSTPPLSPTPPAPTTSATVARSFAKLVSRDTAATKKRNIP